MRLASSYMENVWRVLLPAEVGESFDVYVNGVQQVQHVDYELCGRELWFRREILKEGNLGVARWASMFLGIAGTYRQNDSVDVVYELGGKRLVANDLKLISPNEEI